MKTVTLQIPDSLRIGQAIIVALNRSGDLIQETWTSPDGKDMEIEYHVKGIDLFYLTDDKLQDRLNDLVASDPKPTQSTSNPPQSTAKEE